MRPETLDLRPLTFDSFIVHYTLFIINCSKGYRLRFAVTVVPVVSVVAVVLLRFIMLRPGRATIHRGRALIRFQVEKSVKSKTSRH